MTDNSFNPAVDEWYYPDEKYRENANAPDYDKIYAQAAKDIEAFWGERAKSLDWFAPWERVLDRSNAPFFKWFVGGKINIAYNALDRHVKTWRRNKVALIWEGEPGEKESLTYWRLHQEVNKFANVLRSMGVKKGDRITIYMGRIPEIIIAMLSCAKVGAVHSVIYGGFSEQAIADRIEDANSRLLITCDGAWLRGQVVPLKETVDKAISKSPIVETVIVVKRTGQPVSMEQGRDYWYHDLMGLPIASPRFESVEMDAEDPLFILYTSGTTGKPKGILHTHGGYAVFTSTTLSWVFDLKDDDRWWCAADPGWITGHSYIVYAPLILGATSFMYEGAPNFPYPNRWWKMVEDHGISVLYTAPTAIRGLMRFGEAWPNRHDLSSLRLLGSVGEPINPEAWRWYFRVVGKEHAPIMDTWWQTETGGFMITPLPHVALKPGSATRPFPGIEIDIVDEEGNSVPPGTDGNLVIKQPWPGMLRTIYGDADRFVRQYWSQYAKQGWYLTGDSARRDKDGYVWIIGRNDDVIKVSGYRLGTAEVESGLVSHPAVAEAAAVGVPDEVRGNVIYAYCILKAGYQPSEALVNELKDHIRQQIGPIAVPTKLELVTSLPKTRSGKIMRRVIRARAMGMPEGDTTTLEE
ncbi:MAG: acetate--CoA ligase [Chloroflexi bacterium]|nr:acetate--CoA ligase [Chloroflexota bacterium]